jgi:hypothetical protein
VGGAARLGGVLPLVAAALLLLVPAPGLAVAARPSGGISFSALVAGHWVPRSASTLDPVSIGNLISAAIVTHRKAQARALVRLLRSRGRRAFDLGVPFDAFQDGRVNPATTAYLVTIALTNEAVLRAGGSPAAGLDVLRTIPFAGHCWAYSNSPFDARAGCVHDDNLYTLVMLSRLTRPQRRPFAAMYERALAYERQSARPAGNWVYWDGAPRARRTLIDMSDIAWLAFELRRSPDPRLRRLARNAYRWVRAHAVHPFRNAAFPEIVAGLVANGDPRGCELVSALRQWASRVSSPTYLSPAWRYVDRRRIVAAYVDVWATPICRARRASLTR